MSIFSHQLNSLRNIYSDHVWIDIDPSYFEKQLSPADLNHIYINKLTEYLAESLGLVVELIFPSDQLNLPLTSNLVNGFALSVSGVRLVFIPSQDLDLMGFEVQREWVELRNWAADYYVPIRVDSEQHCLHLWGFISHQYLQQTASLDQDLQRYEIEASSLITELDALWISCELVTSGAISSEQGVITELEPLTQAKIVTLIDRLRQHKSVFSPRLLLPFAQWGAIVNSPEYLSLYANQSFVIHRINGWFQSVINASNNLAESGWVTVGEIFQQQQPIREYSWSGYMGAKVDGIALSTEQEIQRAVANLYANQTSNQKVALPIEIGDSHLALVYLMQQTDDESLRWKAAEYLWRIDPDNNQHWHRRIKDLGLVMAGSKLGLMIAAIPLIDGTYAILNRIYPIGSQKLPPSVRLGLMSEEGDQICQVESRERSLSTGEKIGIDNYIQLYFTATVGDRFNVLVSMNELSITEVFAV
jgi:Protein of unknown function (DUF1822)